PTHRPHEPVGRQVARGHEAERYGQEDGQEGAPQCDLHGQPHLADQRLPLGPVGTQEVGAIRADVLGVGEQIGDVRQIDPVESRQQDDGEAAPQQDVQRPRRHRLLRRGRNDGRIRRGGSLFRDHVQADSEQRQQADQGERDDLA
ncbi:hypothetical protein CV019_16330, partial [Staphylococcus haemolyticus]